MSTLGVLVLGDAEIGPEIANWIAAYHRVPSRVSLVTRGDQQALKDFKGHDNVEYLGPLDRRESERAAETFSQRESMLITCYWPWILPESSLIGYQGRTLNFHPAFLPKDRGWYPHVHQIRLNRPSGVTLHQLAPSVDQGDIWCQEKVLIPFPSTAQEGRRILQERIVQLFKENWHSIAAGSIVPTPQQGEGNFWQKSSVSLYDHLQKDEHSSVEDLLRKLACRNFGDRSFIRIEGDLGPTYVHVAFTKDGRLS